MSETKIMLGNEAIARGAYEAGVKVSAAYPGTPSTEISENIVQYDEIYAEWSPNEKVATEVAIGASISGVRAMSSMKHVGLNVASDPLYTASYIGATGGLMIVVADDPGLYSSQNEQDTRACSKSSASYRCWSLLTVRKPKTLSKRLTVSVRLMIHRLSSVLRPDWLIPRDRLHWESVWKRMIFLMREMRRRML